MWIGGRIEVQISHEGRSIRLLELNPVSSFRPGEFRRLYILFLELCLFRSILINFWQVTTLKSSESYRYRCGL